MLSSIGGAGFRGGMNLTINLGGSGGGLLVGAATGGCGCPCSGGDGFSPSSELLQTGGLPGFNPFGGSPAADFASLLATPHPGFNLGIGDTAHPWASGGFDDGGALPAALLSGSPFPAFGGGGSLADQALMMQAAASDANQASLIGAQTGAFGSLAGAQGTALAGINPLMNGLMANYGF